jgi:hypothetical protein
MTAQKQPLLSKIETNGFDRFTLAEPIDISISSLSLLMGDFPRLCEDRTYDEEPVSIDAILAAMRSPPAHIFPDIAAEAAGEFIFTDGAKERIAKIHTYFQNKIPILLEGPTGTSKTRSVQIICTLLRTELVRLNLSAETVTEDIMGRLVSDPNTWGGFAFKIGPFIKAFKDGLCLLLDEVNLAPQSVLQCMEAAIDSRQISIEIPGQSLRIYEMHQDFRLIATQNPNEGRFAMKRETLTTKFLSRFTPIEFPEIQADELLKIAEGQARNLGYHNDRVVADLIAFHHEWSHGETTRNSNHCFTIRDVTASIRAIHKLENPFDALMTFYGMR